MIQELIRAIMVTPVYLELNRASNDPLEAMAVDILGLIEVL